MATEQPGGAGRTIIEEMRQIIAFAEEATGLSSRWNGGLLILEDDMGAAQMAQMLSRVPYLAMTSAGGPFCMRACTPSQSA